MKNTVLWILAITSMATNVVASEIKNTKTTKGRKKKNKKNWAVPGNTNLRKQIKDLRNKNTNLLAQNKRLLDHTIQKDTKIKNSEKKLAECKNEQYQETKKLKHKIKQKNSIINQNNDIIQELRDLNRLLLKNLRIAGIVKLTKDTKNSEQENLLAKLSHDLINGLRKLENLRDNDLDNPAYASVVDSSHNILTLLNDPKYEISSEDEKQLKNLFELDNAVTEIIKDVFDKRRKEEEEYLKKEVEKYRNTWSAYVLSLLFSSNDQLEEQTDTVTFKKEDGMVVVGKEGDTMG